MADITERFARWSNSIRAILVISAAAFASAIGLTAANVSKAPDLGRAAGFGVVLALSASLVYWLLSRLGISGDAAGTELAVGVLVFSHIGLARTSFMSLSGWQFLVFGLAWTVAGTLLVRILSQRTAVVVSAIRWGVTAIVAGPLILLAFNPSVALAQGSGPRDLVVIWVDGHAGEDTSKSWGSDQVSTFASQLETLGFETVPNALSSYSMTYASIASTLQTEYVVEAGDAVDPQLRRNLYSLMRGNNRTVEKLRSSGYRYVHIESGWGGTRCGSSVDQCISAAIVEETMWRLLQRSGLAGLAEEWLGHPFTVGSRATLSQLRSIRLDPIRPTVVFAHVLAPHAPMFLNTECDLRVANEGRGLNVWNTYMGLESRERRMDAYEDQMHCIDKQLVEIVSSDNLDSAVVVIMGDHGPDSQSQLTTPLDRWTPAQQDERFSTFVAVRGCGDFGSPPAEIINTFPYLLACLGVEPSVAPLSYRRFGVPVEENFPGALVVEFGGVPG